MPNYDDRRGAKVVSVTELIGLYGNKDGLLIWASGFGSKDAFMKGRYKGATVGTAVHRRIECHLTGQEADALALGTFSRDGTELPDARELANAWKAYCSYYAAIHPGIRGLEVEVKMYHPTRNFAGTTDLMVQTDEGHHLIDWKTSSTYRAGSQAAIEQRRSFYLQASAYAELIRATKNIEVRDATIVCLDKKSGDYHPIEFTAEQLRAGYAAFEALLNAHEAIQALQ